MCWMCDHPGATIEDYFDELRSNDAASRAGRCSTSRATEPHTLTRSGCTTGALPELLVTGVSPQRATRLLNSLARDTLRGTTFTPGQQISVPTGPLVEIVEVNHPDAHMNLAVAFGGPDVRALQLVWADGRGRWPWAPGFCDGRTRQPVLGYRRRAA